MKIVINRCYGGFGLSQEAYKKLIERGVPTHKFSETTKYTGDPKVIYMDYKPNEYWSSYFHDDENRTDPDLIAVIEALGSKEASGQYAELKIVEIPDNIGYEITYCNGIERVEEVHNSWS